MIAGLALPGRPIGNMYFAAWSHTVIMNCLNLSSDLKMGEYLKISPRTMFVSQIWGTVFGAFINYVVMISIVDNNKTLLTTSNGNSSWSGATIQSYNTNASSWALAKYLYKGDALYHMVPVGIAIGAALVIAHRIFVAVSLSLETADNSIFPKSARSKQPILTYLNSSSMPDSSRTISHKPASSSRRSSLVSLCSSFSETTGHGSLRTIRTSSQERLMVQV
jgi:hypothetical protein